MRLMVVILLAILIVAAVGWTGCSILGINPGRRELAFSAIVILIASELACIPLLLSRGSNQMQVAQAGLVGTGIHLLCSLSLAAVVYFKLKPASPFLYWLLAMYWVSLIILAIGAAKAVKAAPTAMDEKK